MAILTIHGRKVDVDIERELDRYNWQRPKWSANRLLACSPFRYDSSPSFYVYTEDTATAFAGSWGDSGGIGDFAKGSFPFLLAYLMDVSEAEAIEYLFSEYATEWDGEEALVMDLSKMRIEKKQQPLGSSRLDKFKLRSPYLEGRGISEAIQQLMQIGYDMERKAVTIPYFLPDGRLANIKYRRTDSKIFFYEKDGLPVRTLVYGIDVIHKKKLSRAIITEAEVDAMYAMTCAKMGAIAVGTSKLSDEKVDMILRSPIEELLIAADNDDAGEGLKQQIIKKLGGRINLRIVEFPPKYKDLNDIKDAAELRSYIENAKAVGTTLNLLA
jgi:5S rRNA maturation endonuclease (ribonuclease M5)